MKPFAQIYSSVGIVKYCGAGQLLGQLLVARDHTVAAATEFWFRRGSSSLTSVSGAGIGPS